MARRERKSREDSLVALPLVVNAVLGLVLSAPEVKDQLFELVAPDVALVGARGNDDTIGLAVDTVLDWIAGARVDGVGGLNVEADETVIRVDGARVLRQDVGDG